MYYGHKFIVYGQYTGNMIIILLNYYRIIWSIIESYGHIFDTYGQYYSYIMVII